MPPRQAPSPKLRTRYVCSNCGHDFAKWSGKCPDCNEWNTLNEEVIEERPAGRQGPARLLEPGQENPAIIEADEGLDILVPRDAQAEPAR